MAYYRFNEIQFENWNFDLDVFTDYVEYESPNASKFEFWDVVNLPGLGPGL